MLSAFVNTIKIPELRRRILFTLAVIVIVRLGAAITTPGVNQAVLQEWFRTSSQTAGGGVAALFNLFSGGALENCAIFSLGIMPYISASIMMQLLTAVIPRLGRLAREDGGRQKIMQYTRYATLILCIFQGYLLALSFQHPESYHTMLPGITETIRNIGIPLVDDMGLTFRIVTVISLTTGTLFLMWLGDQITERGIGNGISLIITIGIVARLPAALAQAWKTFVPSSTTGASQVNPMVLVILVLVLFFVIAAVIAVTQGVRKITVQYAKRVVGRKMYGGQTQYMPLKVNYAGVMPIIFAWALLLFPTTIVGMAFKNSRVANQIASAMSNGWPHYVFLAAMIFFFSYFWVATQFQPSQIADDLKKYGGYIPGVRPGKPTSDFLDFTMTRLTFAGAAFLTIIAVFPSLLSQWLHVPQITAQFFGGTSLLIIVGVMLDTMRQVETHLIQRHYDGFLRKGRIRGRSFDRASYSRGEAAGSGALMWLYVGIAVIVIGGVAIFLYGK
ncbi:MAG: preprotein translocase subunit SecY [Verrucomicrobiota bacterium]|jgi:preprotein translocase subunit SecY